MHPLATTIVGSYPQPDWLIDRAQLGRACRRGFARASSGASTVLLEQAQDDATACGPGRWRRRASTSSPTARSVARATRTTSRPRSRASTSTTRARRSTAAGPILVPRVVGPIRRARPVQVRDPEFLRSLTDRPIRATVPGPFTLTPAGAGRALPRRVGARARVRGGGERGAARPGRRRAPTLSRSTSPSCSRGPSDAREYARRGDRPRAPGSGRDDGAPHLLRLRGARPREAERGYSFLAELDAPPSTRSRSRPPSRGSTWRLAELPSKRVILGVLDLGDWRSRARDRRGALPRARSTTSSRTAHGRPGLRDEVPPPRGRPAGS